MEKSHGGYREGAGRKPLGGEGGSRRVSVKVGDMNLSMLPEQRAFLERLGGGNRSAGVRKLLAFAEVAIMAESALYGAIGYAVVGGNIHKDLKTLYDAIKELMPNADDRDV